MKKFIFLLIATVIVAVIFDTMAMPFITAYFQPDNISFVNNQLSNDGIMSGAAVQAGVLPDTIIMMVVNFILLIAFFFFAYKAYEEYMYDN